MGKLVRLALLLALIALVVPATAAAHGKRGPSTVSADKAIVSVYAYGFVDTDGAKLSAIDVKYNVDMRGADVCLAKYKISDYGTTAAPAPEIGQDPGKATRVYVDRRDSHHVIIEVNTDYQLGSVAPSYKWAMMAGVIQTGTIRTCGSVITPGTAEVKNYHVVSVPSGPPDHPTMQDRDYADDGTYSIAGTEGFKLFTKDAGTAFKATDCWDEATGKTSNVDLPYALYVPKNYDPHKRYALVLHIHDAGFMGDDPMIALTESQGAVNFASQRSQEIAMRQGLGGVIVVCPQIADSLRSTRDDYSVSAAVPATWQLMDYLTKKYNVDMNRVYGEGQSMGGMQVAAMAAQRDNYFAAWWANGCQWGSNFSLDDPTYNGTPYYQAPADGRTIWTKDAHGNTVNYRNWYYLISDDNVFIDNCIGDNFSTSVWKECKYLYRDLVGAEIPYTHWNPLTTSKRDQNAALCKLFRQHNRLGMYWAAFDGGNHMATWIYSHGVSAAYDWLLTQTRTSEMKRHKLDLNKPFERAAVQSTDADRLLGDGKTYLTTGKAGAGTLYYNSALYGRGPNGPGSAVTQPPGWWPLQAGAGESPIVFPAAMFDPLLPNLEGFNGVIHDNPYARVLVLNNGKTKAAICSLELVNIPAVSITDCKNVVSATTGVPVDNVWVHATHAITTPHYPGNADHSPDASVPQALAYFNAVHDAITTAAQQAATSYHDALAGWGTGTCNVNMNKDIQNPAKTSWGMGLGSTMPSNHILTLLRVDSTAGQPIGFLISYGIKPTCIDNSGGTKPTDPTWTGTPIRQISSDVPGLACRLVEKRFNAPALFCMPAAADQVPSKWAYPQVWSDAQNKWVQTDAGIATGLAYVDELGHTMARVSIGVADGISTAPKSRKIALTSGSITTLPKPGTKDQQGNLIDNIPVDIAVSTLRFGDAAFVGFKPEMNCVTEQQIQAAAPYAHTLMISFMNGDQKYMPDANACALNTTEYQKSGFKAGTAEMLRDYALTQLNSLISLP